MKSNPSNGHLQDHPIASIFPLLSGDELQELADDIKANGLNNPIWLYEDKILDGRNRYRACQKAGVSPRFSTYAGESPTAFVVSENLKRRHLNQSQKGVASLDSEKWFALEAEKKMLAGVSSPSRINAGGEDGPYLTEDEERRDRICGKCSEEFYGRPHEHECNPARKRKAQRARESSNKAAQMIGVSRRYVQDAKAISIAAPEKLEAIRRGEKTITEVNREIKREQTVKRVAAFPTDKYRIIYADPPWKYGDTLSGDLSENYGGAEKHYAAMSISELCALPILNMVAPDAVLFLWVTSPLLFESMPVIRAWGFQYKTSFVWDKVKHNMGHYNSVRHEFLLICTRGSCTPDVKKLHDSVVTEERSDQHSEKPETFRAIIDEIYPHGKRIELFARRKVNGWETWGAEA